MVKGGFGKTVKVFGVLALLGGLSACSTTQTVKVTEAAPVTYKIGQGPSQYASVTQQRPTALANPVQQYEQPSPIYRPQTIAPPVAQPTPVPAPIVTQAPEFDLSGIDRELYSHMKVGKRYTVAGQSYTPHHNPDYDEVGLASWYGDKFHGKPTANGEVYDKLAMTAAHKTLPLNSFVIVTNLDSKKAIKVRLNDRGPFIDGRIIDLSEAAARELGITTAGLGRVRVQYAGPADPMDSGEKYVDLTPVAPAQPVQQPQIVEATPQVEDTVPFSTDVYRPLRDNAGDYSAPRVADIIPEFKAPQSSAPAPDVVSQPQYQTPNTSLPQLPAIPQPAPSPEDDGVVTLTIKGPIHMAKSEARDEKPRFIPAVHKVTRAKP